MHSVWQRLSAQLAAWFPRTTAYLKDESTTVAPAPAVKALRTTQTPRAAAPAVKAAKPKVTSGYVPLKISQAPINAMRDGVAQAVVAGLISAPSDEQWAMIVAKKPITRVFAGAGSGKSATLVLRILFMLKHLKIPLAQMTVISFTNASCTELRERLVALAAFWQYPLSMDEATQLVRTFHSAMGMQARSVWPNISWFEQLASGKEAELDQLSVNLKPAQLVLLTQAFNLACAEQEFSTQVEVLSAQVAADAPVRLAGMLRATPLVELFFQEGSFAQSVGLEVAALTADAGLGPKESAFITALAQFWPHLIKVLGDQQLMSFDQAFVALTQQPAPLAALEPMQHVLIDEFQDISPQILKWLLRVQGQLADAGQAISLMAIGDDWQSIYGWRGSSPELFIAFDRLLKAHGIHHKSHVLTFATNYRCESAVLASAQQVLTEVTLKQDKGCVAAKTSAVPNEAVRVVEGFDSRTHLADVVTLIEQLLAKDPALAIMVLSRRNQELKRLKPLLKPQWPVQLLSIHKAKGLQCSVAIILDDCHAPMAHPVRNALYAQAKLFGLSYEQAMHDESLRLGYVAMTRAMTRVVWFTQKRQGATRWLV